jgi:hypothetical protein
MLTATSQSWNPTVPSLGIQLFLHLYTLQYPDDGNLEAGYCVGFTSFPQIHFYFLALYLRSAGISNLRLPDEQSRKLESNARRYNVQNVIFKFITTRSSPLFGWEFFLNGKGLWKLYYYGKLRYIPTLPLTLPVHLNQSPAVRIFWHKQHPQHYQNMWKTIRRWRPAFFLPHLIICVATPPTFHNRCKLLLIQPHAHISTSAYISISTNSPTGAVYCPSVEWIENRKCKKKYIVPQAIEMDSRVALKIHGRILTVYWCNCYTCL